jgi:HicB family
VTSRRRLRSRQAVKSARKAVEGTRNRPVGYLVQADGDLYTRDMVRGPSLAEEPAASGDGDEEQTGPSPAPEAGARHSGKLLVRMPATLHDELARVAQDEGVSLNQLITGVLASSVGWRGSGVEPVTLRSAGQAEPGAAEPPISPRLTRAALLATLAVVLLAGIAAIVLLVAAWQAGF